MNLEFHGAPKVFWIGGLLAVMLSGVLSFLTATTDGTYALTFGGIALIALAFIMRKKAR